RLLGYRRDEILARDVIETLVPPEARDAYHHLLQRYLGRGDGPLLGRRLEVTAMRRDHSQFLAELTVTRVPLEGQSLFTAYVRDISESRRQEEQLREETRLAETLYRVGRSLSGELDLQRIVQMVTDETTSLTGAQFGAFF